MKPKSLPDEKPKLPFRESGMFQFIYMSVFVMFIYILENYLMRVIPRPVIVENLELFKSLYWSLPIIIGVTLLQITKKFRLSLNYRGSYIFCVWLVIEIIWVLKLGLPNPNFSIF